MIFIYFLMAICAIGLMYLVICAFWFEEADTDYKLNTVIDCVEYKFEGDKCVKATLNGKPIKDFNSDKNPRETVYWSLISSHNLWLDDYGSGKYSTMLRRRDNISVNLNRGGNYMINLKVEFV